MTESAEMDTEGDYECATCGDPLNIVGLVIHECDRVLSATELSKSERNTLMYVENRVVDHQGELDPEQMNWEDRQNLKVFHAAGIIEVKEQGGELIKTRDGRMRMDLVEKFTDAAWDIVRDCRQMRAADWIDRDIDLGGVGGVEDV